MIIFFDIDDTLLDHTRAENAAAAEFHGLHRAVFPDSPGEFVKRWAVTARKHIDRYLAGELTFQGQRAERIKELFSHRIRLTDAEADRLFESYLHSYERNWRTFADVAGCLADLAGKRLGVITNGDSVQQRKKLETLGLTGCLSPIIVSGEVGVSKPDAGIFSRACAQAGVDPSECWHVGDDLELDARGGIKAGLHAIWLNRKGLPRPEGVPTITSLSELKGLIRG
jgi:putative hydrolase of the HAD superfamily